jgi:glyoxylase-like metal-dependent hydrolase (beta-lactamase superfamily II)
MHTWNWRLLRAGHFRLDGGGMFGLIPKTIWSQHVTPDEQNRIPLQTNCLLLDDGERTVLIETGYGDKWTARDRAIFALEPRTVLDALAELDVEPATIDTVIVSHLHFDHAAGLTIAGDDGAAAPAFPNAEVIVQATEWTDARANKSTMTRTYLPTHLDPIADRLRTVDGESEVLPGIHVFPTAGHTWGHQSVRFADEAGIVCFPGDLLPTVHHAPPAYSLAYDMLPYQTMLEKVALLERAHRQAWRLVLDHEPGPPVVRVCEGDRPGRYGLEVLPGSNQPDLQ